MGASPWDITTSELYAALFGGHTEYRLGIGGRKDADQARKWYQRVSILDVSGSIVLMARRPS